MKLVADLHVHSVASGHAYSTIAENAEAAARKGLELIAITDHGPAMPGGPHLYHFGNLRVVPSEYTGVRILKGAEANIVDSEGALDIPERYLKRLDIVLAGFHSPCYKSGGVKQNTVVLTKLMSNPLIDIIVHPGNPEFEINAVELVRAAKDLGVALELNNSSLGTVRKGSYDHCLEIALQAAKMDALVVLGSDAHWAEDVGGFKNAISLAKEAGIRPEQVVNTSVKRIDEYLEQRKKLC